MDLKMLSEAGRVALVMAGIAFVIFLMGHLAGIPTMPAWGAFEVARGMLLSGTFGMVTGIVVYLNLSRKARNQRLKP